MAIILRNKTYGRELELRLVDNFVEGLTQDVFDMDFPESSAEEKLIMRISGQAKKITMTSKLFDSATDLSDGDAILTKDQQKIYLIGTGNTSNSIFTKGISDEWELEIDSETFPCIIEDITSRRSAGNPMDYEVNYSIIVGTSG